MTSLDRLPLIINNQPVRPPNSPVVTTYSTKTKEDYIQYVSATPDDAVNAVESSYTAFKSWSKTQPRVRQNILRKTAALIHQHAQELIQIQVTETNCPELWAKNNVLWAAMHLEEMAARITSVLTGELPVVQTPGQMGMVFKRPIGPVLSIPPWNASLFLACRAIDTPLSVGCTVVLKASEQSPRTHHCLVDLFHQAGLPAGVLNVIQTRREDAAVVTEVLIAHRHIRKIEFIGSAVVGRRIGAIAGKYLKPMMMELGGKAAALVLDDADLNLAAHGCVHGGYMHNEQTCFSTERIIVNAAVLDEFLPILKEAASNFPVLAAVSNTGSENTLRMVKGAVAKGAKLIYGEAKLLEPAKLQPVMLTGVTREMDIYDEESFGPVLTVYVVNSDQEAIELANSSKSGLSAGVYSKDVARALAVATQIEAGQTHINFPFGTGTDEATLPEGMGKSSGWGRQNGRYGLEEFLEVRTVTVTNPEEFTVGMKDLGLSL